jgi:flagellar hook-basal body complex protein FliE
MSWEAIQAVAQVQSQAGVAGPERLQLAQPAAGVEQGGFGAMVGKALGEVNQKLLASQTDLQQLAVGNVQNLHQVMIRLEESQLSFQLLMQVRSRVLEAYQDIMKMQV